MIQRLFTSALTSPALRDLRRGSARAARKLARRERTVSFFAQIDDPYGPAAVHFLARLAHRHALRIAYHLVPPPDASAAPEAALLAAYSRRDAARIEAALGLGPSAPMAAPVAEQVACAQRIAAAVIARGGDGAALAAITRALGDADVLGELAARHGEVDADTTLGEGAALRLKLGHYLGSTSHFEGEFYWGVDRLHYLEDRLRAEDDEDRPRLCPRLDAGPYPPAPPPVANPPRLDCYLSFRSPYSLVAAERVGALARAYGARLNLKFVLPMVMRRLPVPRAKQIYITLDTKREAARHGVGFGTICDPVGLGVERGLAVLHHVMPTGKGLDFAIAFLRAAFANGIDMTSDAALIRVAAGAGVSEGEVRGGLADPGWRAVAEANRADLFALGLWGVPSFQVDDRPAWWGQDRLWMIEDDLRAATGLAPIDRRMA